MQFEIVNKTRDDNFKLVFRSEEQSFDIEHHSGQGFTSILINYINIEVTEEGHLSYVWGVCPLENAIETTKKPENIVQKGLVFKPHKELVPGISIKINEDDFWQPFINHNDGWVCIGNPDSKGEMIEFVNNCIAVLKAGQLKSLWLKPIALP